MVDVRSPSGIRFSEAVTGAGASLQGDETLRQMAVGLNRKLGRSQVTRKDEGFLEARRADCRAALVDGGVSPDQAERWCATWEAEATRQGVIRNLYYWDAGRGWIDAQRALRELRWLTIAPDVGLSQRPQ